MLEAGFSELMQGHQHTGSTAAKTPSSSRCACSLRAVAFLHVHAASEATAGVCCQQESWAVVVW
jgi:hypothetical protein